MLRTELGGPASVDLETACLVRCCVIITGPWGAEIRMDLIRWRTAQESASSAGCSVAVGAGCCPLILLQAASPLVQWPRRYV